MNQFGPGRYTRFLFRWHGLDETGSGYASPDRVLDRLQGYVLPFSDLELRVLPDRLPGYRYGDLDRWCEEGRVSWQGHERISAHDGAISLLRPEQVSRLARIRGLLSGDAYIPLRNLLAVEGARQFPDITASLGGFPPQILRVLWDLVWAGEVSNLCLKPLFSLLSGRLRRRRRGQSNRLRMAAGRGPNDTLPGAAGSWYLIAGPESGVAPQAERDQATVEQLLQRWGVVNQRCLQAEGIRGGMSRFATQLDELESTGRVVRGAFIAGCGKLQFATPDALRALESESPVPEAWVVAATDPVNPYGKLVTWPKTAAPKLAPQRVAGARVVLCGRGPLAYLAPAGHDLMTFPDALGRGDTDGGVLIRALAREARPERSVLLRTVDGRHPATSPWSKALLSGGFTASRNGYLCRR